MHFKFIQQNKLILSRSASSSVLMFCRNQVSVQHFPFLDGSNFSSSKSNILHVSLRCQVLQIKSMSKITIIGGRMYTRVHKYLPPAPLKKRAKNKTDNV